MITLKTHFSLLGIACVVFLSFALAVYPNFAHAENQVNDAIITMSPQYAGIGEKITATLRTSAIDLQSSLIIWTLDAAAVGRGIGVSEATFSLADSQKHEITATITDQTGYSVKITQIVRASDVDILWEGISYVPPGYKGRALYSDGGKVKVTAIPHSDDKKTASDYIYTWTQDGKALIKSSGFGKYALTIDTPLFGDAILLSVQVKTLQGEYIGGTGVRITPSPVTVSMYEHKPLLGLWMNTTVKNSRVADGEVTLRALPYFMDISSITDTSTKYAWSVSGRNSQISQSTGGKAVLSEGKNSPEVTVTIVNKSKLLQEGSAREHVGTSEGKSLFGL